MRPSASDTYRGCSATRTIVAPALVLNCPGTFGPAPLEKPVEILALEAKAAAIAELGGQDRAFTRPAPDRFLVHAETCRCL